MTITVAFHDGPMEGQIQQLDYTPLTAPTSIGAGVLCVDGEGRTYDYTLERRSNGAYVASGARGDDDAGNRWWEWGYLVSVLVMRGWVMDSVWAAT